MKTFVFLLFIFCAVIYGNTVEGGLTSKVALSSFVKQKKQFMQMVCFVPNPVINGQIRYTFPPGYQGSPEDPEYIEGTRLEYACDTGYRLQGPEFITCEITGSWSSDPPSCIKTFCEDPGFIENGNRTDGIIESSTPRKFQKNEFVIFYCKNDKFALRGSPLLSCKDGSWSRPIPRCIPAVAATCSDPGQVPNADRYNSDGSLSAGVSSFKEGQIVVYSCKPNFYLQRRSFLTCLPSGQWSHSLPECIDVNSDPSIGFPEQTDCGVSSVKPTPRISQGRKMTSGEWPWVVAIAVPGRFSNDIICGGAVLDTRTVLTAAHCLESSDSYVLYFGKKYRNDDLDDEEVVVRRSTRIVPHQSYNRTTYDSDIALIWFSPPLENYTHAIQPICLPTPETTSKNLMTGKMGYISGWGETERGLKAEQMLLAELPVVPPNFCVETFKSRNLSLVITPNMFCAGYAVSHKNRKQNVCQGDSGSPLSFYDEDTERNVVEGVVSFRAETYCGTPGRYAVFTVVSRFVPWIHRNKS